MSNQIIKLRDQKKTDKEILRHLLEDSRQPLSKIAEKIGTTRQNVSQRIKKLKQENIIKSFTIEVNRDKIEELTVNAYILFREDPDTKNRKENEKKIVKIPEVTEFARLFGKYDGLIEVIVKDKDEVKKIVYKLHSFKGIKETETLLVHSIIKIDNKSPVLNLLK